MDEAKDSYSNASVAVLSFYLNGRSMGLVANAACDWYTWVHRPLFQADRGHEILEHDDRLAGMAALELGRFQLRQVPDAESLHTFLYFLLIFTLSYWLKSFHFIGDIYASITLSWISRLVVVEHNTQSDWNLSDR